MPADFIIDDAQNRKTKDFAEVIRKIGERLATGTVTLKGVQVTPPAVAHCVLRYERTPHRSYKLKIELEWHENGREGDAEDDLDKIVG